MSQNMTPIRLVVKPVRILWWRIWRWQLWIGGQHQEYQDYRSGFTRTESRAYDKANHAGARWAGTA